MGGPPTDFTYPRVIERELLRGGRNVVVRNLAVTSEQVKTGLKNWEAPGLPLVPGRGGAQLRALRGRAPLPAARPRAPRQQPAGTPRSRAQVLPPVRAAADLEDAGGGPAEARREGPGPGVQPPGQRASPTTWSASSRTPCTSATRWCCFPRSRRRASVGPPGSPASSERIDMINDAMAEVVTRFDRDNVRVFDTTRGPGSAHRDRSRHRAGRRALHARGARRHRASDGARDRRLVRRERPAARLTRSSLGLARLRVGGCPRVDPGRLRAVDRRPRGSRTRRHRRPASSRRHRPGCRRRRPRRCRPPRSASAPAR